MTTHQDTILIVDDNEANRELIAILINRIGYNIIPVENGPKALDILNHQHVDLVLLDLMLPGMSGHEVLRIMKSDDHLKHIPVVMISAVGNIQDVVKCIEMGAEDYLYKPINRVLLKARVDACLEKKRLREQEIFHLEELSKTKDRFVRTVSHELKQPIALIKGYVDLMIEDNMVAEPDAKEYILNIHRYTEQMENLIQDLLQLSAITNVTKLSLAVTPIAELLEKGVEGYRILAEQKAITIDYQSPARELQLVIDPNRIIQVINNLLSNAIKYTPKGGQILLSAEVNHGTIHISVTDNGLGIPTEDLPHIFDQFYRVQSDEHMEAQGTGLGLAIAKTIAEQHKGSLSVESELGIGSKFTLTLPLSN